MRVKRHLQKYHYLSEFLSLSEILNFFVDTSPRRFRWHRPHRPIGRPNRQNLLFLNWNGFLNSKNEKNSQKSRFIFWPEMAEIKKFCQNLLQLSQKTLGCAQNVFKCILHLYLRTNLLLINHYDSKWQNLKKNWVKKWPQNNFFFKMVGNVSRTHNSFHQLTFSPKEHFK